MGGRAGLFGSSKKRVEESTKTPKGQSEEFTNPMYASSSEPVWQENPMYESSEQAAEMTTQSGIIRIKYLKESLEQSERGGMGKAQNSDKYNKIMQTLNSIVGHFSSDHFTDNVKDNLSSLTQVKNLYVELNQSCNSYLDRISFTTKGSVRRSLVSQIQMQSTHDLEWIGNNINVVAYTKQGDTWESILSEARTRKVEVNSMESLGTVGGAASVNYKIREAQGDGTEKLKFFKKEEKFVQRGDADRAGSNERLYLEEGGKFVKERFNLKHPSKKSLLNKFENLMKEYRKPEKSLEDPVEVDLEPLQKALVGKMKAYATTDEVFKSMGHGEKAGTQRGDEINITNRNVAMSRMASLFGVESLLAKSEIVDVVDKSTGEVHRGNLMEGAEGMDYNELMKEKKDSPATSPLANKVKPEQFSSVLGSGVSGSLMKEMTSLQVLDIICGQVDRHMNNVKFRRDDAGKLAHITGIDNDASFGFNEEVASKHSERKDKSVFNLTEQPGTGEKSAKLCLPRMDNTLAERILAVTPDMVKFSLVGLLTEAEIAASLTRLGYLKQAIAKEKTEKPETFITRDEDWNGEAQSALMAQTGTTEVRKEEIRKLREEYQKAKVELKNLEDKKSMIGIKRAQSKLERTKDELRKKLKEIKDAQRWAFDNTSYYADFMSDFMDLELD